MPARSRSLLGLFATMLTVLSLSTVPAHADFMTGFEPTPAIPAYSLGNLAGQNGWSVFGPGVVTVENFLVKTGTQAVFVDGGVTATSQSGPYHTDSAGPVVNLSADIYLASSSVETSWQFAALNFFPPYPFDGGIDVNAGTNTIQAITAGMPVIGTFTRDQWNHVDILLNFTTQLFGISINGSTLASNLPFCEAEFACTSTGTVASYSSGFFDTFGGVTGSNDLGIIDNYAVTTTPEPTSLLLFGSVLALSAKRFLARLAKS